MTLTPLQEAWLHHKRGELYTPPKRTPEQIREDWERCIWNAQRGIRGAKRMLDKANSNEQREKAEKSLQRWQGMLHMARKELGEL
jgi:hypothetical protein